MIIGVIRKHRTDYGEGDVGAYNDGGITAGDIGAIPELATVASGFGLLALGAAGIREMRRRRAAGDTC